MCLKGRGEKAEWGSQGFYRVEENRIPRNDEFPDEKWKRKRNERIVERKINHMLRIRCIFFFFYFFCAVHVTLLKMISIFVNLEYFFNFKYKKNYYWIFFLFAFWFVKNTWNLNLKILEKFEIKIRIKKHEIQYLCVFQRKNWRNYYFLKNFWQ